MSLIYSEQVGGRRHGLYLGGKTDAKARDQLERWGVTHILNVTPPKEGSIQVLYFHVVVYSLYHESFSPSHYSLFLSRFEGLIT